MFAFLRSRRFTRTAIVIAASVTVTAAGMATAKAATLTWPISESYAHGLCRGYTFTLSAYTELGTAEPGFDARFKVGKIWVFRKYVGTSTGYCVVGAERKEYPSKGILVGLGGTYRSEDSLATNWVGPITGTTSAASVVVMERVKRQNGTWTADRRLTINRLDPAGAWYNSKAPGAICHLSPGKWCDIAKCESGDRNVNTGNGYYGYLQFSRSTWRGIGGTGYPHEHTAGVQLEFAKKLQAKYGWGQWSCA